MATDIGEFCHNLRFASNALRLFSLVIIISH
jgi:hypothetical protein